MYIYSIIVAYKHKDQLICESKGVLCKKYSPCNTHTHTHLNTALNDNYIVIYIVTYQARINVLYSFMIICRNETDQRKDV